jgi:hypothetical protein
MARTVAEIEADLVKYRARRDDLLDPNRAERLKHGDREIGRAGSSAELLAQIERRISELEIELARASGKASPRRPLGV